VTFWLDITTVVGAKANNLVGAHLFVAGPLEGAGMLVAGESRRTESLKV
jgi:hypothetical protein